LSLELQKENDQANHLFNMGTEHGFAPYDPANDMPFGKPTSAEGESLFSADESHNLAELEDAPAPAGRGEPADTQSGGSEIREDPASGEAVEIGESAHPPEGTSDPFQVYLREMRRVPLLKREGEVAIAKRLGSARALVLKTLSRSPVVLHELIAIGNELRNGTRSIREVVQLDEEDLGVEEIAIKTRVTLRTIDKIEKLHAEALQQATRLNGPQKTRGSARPRARRQLSRTQVEMSQLVRSIRFHPLEQKRLIEVLR